MKTSPPSAVEAWQQRERGNELLNFAEYKEAVRCFERAIEILSAMGLRWQELADVWEGKAKALSRLRRHDEAIRAFDEAIAIEKELYVENDDTLNKEQAGTVMNKGLALTNAGRVEEGTACHQMALAAFRREWANGSPTAGALAALTVFNIGQSHIDPGRFDEALQRYNEALEIHRRLAAERGGVDSKDAAIVLTAKSKALVRVERFNDALTAAEEAVKILEPLATRKGGDYLKLDLSLALLRQGKALERLYRPVEASRCFQRSTELVREVKRNRGHSYSLCQESFPD